MKRGAEDPVEEESNKKAKIENPLAPKIKKQVEFYFGDSNYSRDKFMQETAGKNDGWIPLPTLFLFKRLAAMTTDPEVLYEACKDSPLLTFDEAKTKVKRATEVAKEVVATYKARSVDVAKIPDGATMESIEEHFASHGKVLSVRLMLRQGKFANAARVEFESEEVAKKLVEAKEVDWTNGEKLTIKSATTAGEDKGEKEEKGGKGEKGNKQRQQKEKVPRNTYIPGIVLRISNLTDSSAFNRNELREYMSKFGKVLFVDTYQAEKGTLVRFQEPAGVQEALKELEAKTAKFNDVVLEGAGMPAEEEEQYWKTKVVPGMEKKPRSKNHRR